jgi:hypothetical protein
VRCLRGAAPAALVLLLCLPGATRAEAPTSPYRLFWSFPGDEVSAIDVDRGDLDKSRFKSDYELVQYLAGLPKEKPQKPKPGAGAAPPARELRVDQLDGEGKVRATLRYVAPLSRWRKRLGDDFVDRVEDEFDAHLRMILPRRNAPEHTPGPPAEKK